MVTVQWFAAVCSTTAFWNPVKPWHLISMLSKLIRCTENCNACSQHWSTERFQFFSTTTPDHMCTTSASKVERIGLQSFALSAIFTWPLVIGLPPQAFWQLFAGKTLPQSAGGRKCFPRVPQILRRGFLFYRNKQIYFSLAIMFIVMIPILINQVGSEPSYNDLKLMVRNLYFCTNLI